MSYTKNYKTLVLDDDVFKTMNIKRALNANGISDIISVDNQEEGMGKIYESLESKTPFQLIVTDMHYPLKKWIESDRNAGFKLVERLKAESIEIPIIICSSRNFYYKEVLGCVWYNELRDLQEEFQKVLSNLHIEE